VVKLDRRIGKGWGRRQEQMAVIANIEISGPVHGYGVPGQVFGKIQRCRLSI
jgi:hypothetical protein